MSTHNIAFYEDLTKIIFELHVSSNIIKYHQILTLFLLLLNVNLLHSLHTYWVIFHAFLSSTDFSKINFLKKYFQEYHQNVKQFGP